MTLGSIPSMSVIFHEKKVWFFFKNSNGLALTSLGSVEPIRTALLRSSSLNLTLVRPLAGLALASFTLSLASRFSIVRASPFALPIDNVL